MSRRLFCEINPLFYQISLRKEIIRRHLKNRFGSKVFASKKSTEKLEHCIYEHNSYMIKKGKDIDPTLQYNKAINIDLASKGINGVLVYPGETFSMWKLVGPVTTRRGFKKGRVIVNDTLVAGTGGGLCNLANTISVGVLHTPLDIVEEHRHSDALAPDPGKRTPLSAGTSVSYNTLDFQFENNTDQVFQFLTWCKDDYSYLEIRSDKPIPFKYEIEEEDHHFAKEGDKYYRNSKIYRITKDKATNKVLSKELYLDNHSIVMFDHALIPKDQIKN